MDVVDYNELEDCIFTHNSDVYFRDTVLELTALKMLLSKNTNMKHGYIRAKRFINEFNKKLGINLSTSTIDKIMINYQDDLINSKNYELKKRLN